MRFITFVTLFLGISASVPGFAGTTDPHTPDSKYVAFGEQFPSVIRLRAKIKCTNPDCPQKEHTQTGSAVIIKPNWILTAAHVVHGTHSQTAVKDDGSEYALQKIVVHKDFDDAKIGFHDLALGYSAEDFALPFYTPLYDTPDEVGKPITIAGYGIYGTFLTGGTHSDGKKRAGHNVIDSVDRAVLLCSPSRGSKRMPLEFVITPGDSGGGMFIGNKLAGINSFLLAADKQPDGTYGDEAAFTRVSLYADWVAQQVEQHELAMRGQSTLAADIAFPEKAEQ